MDIDISKSNKITVYIQSFRKQPIEIKQRDDKFFTIREKFLF